MFHQFKYQFLQTRFSLARCRNSYFQAASFFQFAFFSSDSFAVSMALGVSKIQEGALSCNFSSGESLRVDTLHWVGSMTNGGADKKSDFPIEKRDISVHPNHISVHPSHKSVHPNHISVYPNHISVYPNHISIYPNNKSVYPNNKSVEKSASARRKSYKASCHNHFVGINFLQTITSQLNNKHQYLST